MLTGKRNSFFKGVTTWLKADLSTATLNQRDKWESISKVLRENNCHLEFYSIRNGTCDSFQHNTGNLAWPGHGLDREIECLIRMKLKYRLFETNKNKELSKSICSLKEILADIQVEGKMLQVESLRW